jgi:uncharacterized DUF497 family protein
MVTGFDWDDDNEDHVARHGIDPSEAEEAIRRFHLEEKGRGGLRLAWGTTAFGRYVLVVFSRKGSGILRVITARDMSPGEKKSFRRRTKQ